MLKMIQKICLVAILLALSANASANRLKGLVNIAKNSDQAVKKMAKDGEALKKLRSEFTDVLGRFSVKDGDEFQWDAIFNKMYGAVDDDSPADSAEVFRLLTILIERSEEFSAIRAGNPLRHLLLHGGNLLHLRRAENGAISFSGDISQSLFPLSSNKWKSLADEAAGVLSSRNTGQVAKNIGEIFALQSDRLLYMVQKMDLKIVKPKDLRIFFDSHNIRIKAMTTEEQVSLFPDITRATYLLAEKAVGDSRRAIGKKILLKHIKLAKDNVRLEELIMSLDGVDDDIIEWVGDILSEAVK